MSRSFVIKQIMSQVNDDDIVIASTGFISREVHHQKDRPLNFYNMGAMGCSLSIGLGVSLHVPNRVFVIDGDGSALMGLGSLVTAKRYNRGNLYHFILDNNSHESTGGQKTSSHLIDFRFINKNTVVYTCNKDKTIPPRITISAKDMTERFKDALFCKQVK